MRVGKRWDLKLPRVNREVSGSTRCKYLMLHAPHHLMQCNRPKKRSVCPQKQPLHSCHVLSCQGGAIECDATTRLCFDKFRRPVSLLQSHEVVKLSRSVHKILTYSICYNVSPASFSCTWHTCRSGQPTLLFAIWVYQYWERWTWK